MDRVEEWANRERRYVLGRFCASGGRRSTRPGGFLVARAVRLPLNDRVYMSQKLISGAGISLCSGSSTAVLSPGAGEMRCDC